MGYTQLNKITRKLKMGDENNGEILKKGNALYVSNEIDIKLLEDSLGVDGNDEKIFTHIQELTELEKITLAQIIEKYKNSIISWWLKHDEMKEFYSKFELDKEEVTESIKYFGGEKILNYLIDCLRRGKAEIGNTKSLFITTRFLSFIKKKNLGIDDLLRIIIVLKNSVVECFLDEDIKIINHINNIFDEISTALSKNYNDAIIKLLSEYTNAIDNSNIISKTDIFGNIIHTNDEFCKLSGYTREEMIGKAHNIVRHPDMSKATFKEMWETIQNKKIWKGLIKNRTKNGGYYWVKATVVPIIDENDKIVEYISIRTDISELVEANKSREEYSNALNESSLIVKLDIDGNVTSANEEYCNKMRCDIANIKGSNFIANSKIEIEENYLVDDIYNFNTPKDIFDYVKEKKIWKGILKMKSEVGNSLWCTTTIKPILNSVDEIVEFIIMQYDVTDLEIVQQRLKSNLDKQLELDVKKDEFLNIASHELRTPMTSIKGYISMILDGDAGEINDEVKTYLEQVYGSADRLLNLINDMLDISKIESGKQEFNYESIDLNKLFSDTYNEMKTLIERKKQKFKKFIGFEDFEYNTDGNKLKQVLLNIIGNAIKFTPEHGEITLTANKTDEVLSIEIKDTGIGVDKTNFSRIFEKFGQVKNSLTRDISGTGLGLPIAKDIVEKIGGYIIVDSELGVGTKFTINLPINNELCPINRNLNINN